ncbi:hypothetical protein [Paractinoplanes rishiriensis]|uniref:Uncharacterized protein n=1 Tax=Paractinoplanes rishiriensis TaxID=1050105 RepID=A0A919K7R8_9ACTN|nr:hypothetical protein [Actinoplanes rishiriensis]GIF00250.1 hypothetical protein Ari01nite_77140 [Actinoplanes rishiriensis]
MTDPAAGTPDPTRVDGGEEPSTVDAPVRWSGSATVPAASEKQAWWSRRRPAPEHTDWATIPAVDPWEGEDTPVDPFPAVPQMPETHLPPTRLEQPPPTRLEPPPAAKPPKISKKERKARERAARELESARARMADQRQTPVNRLAVQPRPAQPRPGQPRPGQPRSGLPAPPPWVSREPQRPLPPAPRKRRRWGRRFALLSLFGLVCCCGGPIAWFQFPAARQHPVSATLPQTFADLNRRDDNASQRAVERLADELRATDAGTDGAFAGVYGDNRGKRVTLFGVTGFRFNPGTDARTQLETLSSDLKLSGVQKFDLGELGAHEFCGIGRVDGTAVVVCAWADHGSMATVLLTRRSLDDSAELVGRLRDAVLSPG